MAKNRDSLIDDQPRLVLTDEPEDRVYLTQCDYSGQNGTATFPSTVGTPLDDLSVRFVPQPTVTDSSGDPDVGNNDPFATSHHRRWDKRRSFLNQFQDAFRWCLGADGYIDKSRKCRYRTILALLVLLLLILVILMARMMGKSQHSNNPLNNTIPSGSSFHAQAQVKHGDILVCTTSSCVRAAANLLDAIDFSVDPCDNFFDYACGNWNKDHPIPDDMSAYGTFAHVRDLVRQQLRGLLEEPSKETADPTVMTMARYFYRNCMNTTALNVLKSKPIYPILSSLGNWPLLDPSWTPDRIDITRLLANLKHSYATEAFVQLFVYADSKNTSATILTIDKGPLGLGQGTRDYYLNDTTYGQHMIAYQKYIIDIITIVAFDFNVTVDQKVMQDAKEILDFERKFAAITTPDDQRRNHSLMYNKWSMNRLGQESSFINWRLFFEMIMPPAVWSVAKNPEYNVVISEPEFITQLDHLLRKTDKRVVVNYLFWRLVKTWSKVLDNRFDEAFQEFAQVMMGRQQKPVRWKACVPAVVNAFDMAVGALYVERYFQHEDKKEAMNMIYHLQDAFQTLVRGLDWMDEPTKLLAVEKSKAMLNHIGYPEFILNASALSEYYKDLEPLVSTMSYFDMNQKMSVWLQNKDLMELLKKFDRNKFETSPAIVNAYYSPEKNAITFPAGILQPPFFKGDYPKAINYGAMGAVIGHEITHAFDDQGSQYDKDGNLNDWWSSIAFEGFKRRTECIISQYSNYSVPEVKIKVNGKLTQGENIADNGGVKESFMAYKKYLSENGGEEPRLPGLLNLTNQQIFFLSYANFWCGQKKSAAALQQVLTDPHSPEMYRVIGVVSNLDEFSAAFSCPVGSKMNPSSDVRSKCRVW